MTTSVALPTIASRLHVLEIVGNAIVGGMESSVERLIERLPPERVGVTALCPFESAFTDRLRTLGTDVVIAQITDEPSWHAIQLACSLARSNAIDVIHTHLPNAHVLGGIVGRLIDKPVLATIHGRQMTTTDLEVHRAASTHLAAVCRHSHLHALGVGVNPKHLHLVPNGVDTEVFMPGQPRSGALRARFGIGVDVPLVGFAGRLSWEKGPDVFLRTALVASASRPDAHFVLVGEGPMRDPLRAFVERFELGDRVHFAGLQAEMPSVFAEFDVVVAASRSEAMPLAVMEAMACGVPVVACKVGAVPDMVQHGVTGWLVDAGDEEGLSARILDLLSDEAVRLAAGRAGRLRAVERFTLSAQVDAMHDLLGRLAGRVTKSVGPELRDHLSNLR